MYLSLLGSLSSAFLQSTDYDITVHRISMSASLPLYIGAFADRAAKIGVNGNN